MSDDNCRPSPQCKSNVENFSAIFHPAATAPRSKASIQCLTHPPWYQVLHFVRLFIDEKLTVIIKTRAEQQGNYFHHQFSPFLSSLSRLRWHTINKPKEKDPETTMVCVLPLSSDIYTELEFNVATV